MIKQIQNEEKHLLVWVIPAPRKSLQPCTCLAGWQQLDRRVEVLAGIVQLQEHRLRPACACVFPLSVDSHSWYFSSAGERTRQDTRKLPQVPLGHLCCLWCLGKPWGTAQHFASLCQSLGGSFTSAKLLALCTRPPSLSLLNTELTA